MSTTIRDAVALHSLRCARCGAEASAVNFVAPDWDGRGPSEPVGERPAVATASCEHCDLGPVSVGIQRLVRDDRGGLDYWMDILRGTPYRGDVALRALIAETFGR